MQQVLLHSFRLWDSPCKSPKRPQPFPAGHNPLSYLREILFGNRGCILRLRLTSNRIHFQRLDILCLEMLLYDDQRIIISMYVNVNIQWYYECFNVAYDIYISYHRQVPAEASKWETNMRYFDPYQQYQSGNNERKFMHLLAWNSIRRTCK